jgi:hypothetical protein
VLRGRAASVERMGMACRVGVDGKAFYNVETAIGKRESDWLCDRRRWTDGRA